MSVLAELDRIQAAAYLVAKRKDAGKAIKEARLRLEERSLCGNDRGLPIRFDERGRRDRYAPRGLTPTARS
jgi:hypothetical protein